MTILDVAELTGLCWDTVKEIVKERLARDYAHIRLKDLRRLAIDEIYLGRKHKYLTLVIDQESGRIGRARRFTGSGDGSRSVARGLKQWRWI